MKNELELAEKELSPAEKELSEWLLKNRKGTSLDENILKTVSEAISTGLVILRDDGTIYELLEYPVKTVKGDLILKDLTFTRPKAKHLKSRSVPGEDISGYGGLVVNIAACTRQSVSNIDELSISDLNLAGVLCSVFF